MRYGALYAATRHARRRFEALRVLRTGMLTRSAAC